MTYSAVPFEFDTTNGQTRSYEIRRKDGEEDALVGILRRDVSIPVNFDLLAMNFATTLNGKKPVQIPTSHFMFFERGEKHMAFRFRQGEGVSKIGAIFTTNDDAPLTSIMPDISAVYPFMAAAQCAPLRAGGPAPVGPTPRGA